VSFRRTTTVPGAQVASQPVLRGTTARLEAEQTAKAAKRRNLRIVTACALLALVAIGIAAFVMSEPEPPYARPAVTPASNSGASAIAVGTTAPEPAVEAPRPAQAATPTVLPEAKDMPKIAEQPAPHTLHRSKSAPSAKPASATSPASSAAAPLGPRLAADWDERLPTGEKPVSAKPTGKSPAGTLGRNDL